MGKRNACLLSATSEMAPCAKQNQIYKFASETAENISLLAGKGIESRTATSAYTTSKHAGNALSNEATGQQSVKNVWLEQIWTMHSPTRDSSK